MKHRRREKHRLIWLLPCAAAVALAGLAILLFALQAPSREIDGTKRQFFWDSRLIDTEKTTASLTMNSPTAGEIVLAADQPWEGSVLDSFTVVQLDGMYRLYYAAYDTPADVKICYAQSADGIHWEKPAANLIGYNGSTQNNILLDTDSNLANGFFVFVDTNTQADAAERVKAIGLNRSNQLVGYTSADGLVWTESGSILKKALTAPGERAVVNSVFWSEAESRYFCYYADAGKIMVTTSQNFDKWSTPKAVSYQKGAQSATLQTANIVPYYRETGMLVGFPLRVSRVSEEEQSANGLKQSTLTDAVFVSSIDGKTFDLQPQAWLAPGPQQDANWIFGDCRMANGMVETPALHTQQGQDPELSFYVAEENSGTALRRYTTRIDGFMSYHATYNTQKVVTKPFRLDGSRMTLNFASSADGYVFVRILDENGEPYESRDYTDSEGVSYTVPAYTSYKMYGDRVDREVAFNEDLAKLAGKTVVLEFTMSDADLYSFRFDHEAYQNTAEWQPTEIPDRQFEEYRYENEGQVLSIGTERQLFWDDYIVDRAQTTASLVSHAPTRREELFKTDLPWEGDNCDFYVILEDEADGRPLYRMYYLGWDDADSTDIRVCYAYSYDGSEWTKPDLGLHSFTDPATGQVYTQTNIMLYTEDTFDNFFVTKDTRPGVPEDRRYIAVAQGVKDQLGYASYGLWAWASPDGLHWTKTHQVLPQDESWFGAFDSVNTVTWDETTQQFFTYFRIRNSQMVDGLDIVDFRRICGAVADEFVPFDENTIFDLNYGANSPLLEMYTNNIAKYDRAPQLFLGFPTRFVRHFNWEKNYEYLAGTAARKEKYDAGAITKTLSMTEALFMTSRDGYNWTRPSEAWLTPGPEYEANWIYGNCYPAFGLIETKTEHSGQDNELSTYLFEGKFYQEPSVLYRYTFRMDGLRGYQGAAEGQTVTTNAFNFEGTKLLLNFRTSAAGSVRVEILDANGEPIPGYSSGRIIGDRVDREITFENDLRALNGTPVTLRFTLNDAELYSFKFED